MKRIAMISYHTCPLSAEEGKETGGINTYVLELCKELSQLGYTIDIFTREQDKTQPKIVVLNPNLRVIHLSSGPASIVPKKELVTYLPEFAENFVAFVTEEHLTYAVLHCHYYLSGLAALLIQIKLKRTIPLLMTFHTLALMKNLVARNAEEAEDKERIDAEFLLIKKSTKIISPSTSDCSYLTYLYNCPKEKLVVITPGVNTHTFYPANKTDAKKQIGVDKDTKLILFVGRIEPLKGIDILLYALKILLSKCPSEKVSLLIIGGDTSQRKEYWPIELQRLETLRTTLNIKTSVVFLGRRRPEELPYYYNAADIVVMPSHYESFGMTALEAMACGTPVITTDVAGITSITNEKHRNLLITTSNNPLLLATKMHTFLSNEKIRQRVSKDLLATIPSFDWSVIAKKVAALYKKVL